MICPCPRRPDLPSRALPVGTTLDRFILREQSAFPFATGELSQLLRDIALASKIINLEINQAGLIDVTGAAGTDNFRVNRSRNSTSL